MRTRGPRILLVAVVGGCVMLGEPVAASVRTIALSGQNPFGGAEDAAFDRFSSPSLNNRGQVAFVAELAGDDVTTGNDTGHWIVTDGSFDTVAREGDPAVGMPAGTTFRHVSTVTGIAPLNDRGQIATIRSVLLPDASLSSGVWLGDGQSLDLVAAQGDVAPNAQNGATFLSFTNSRTSLNHDGSVAFTNSLSGEPYSTINSLNRSDGVWAIHSDGTAATALAGMEASAIGQPAEYTGFRTFTFPALSGTGQVAFWAIHQLTDGSQQSGSGVWTTSTGGVDLVGYSGEPLPELGPNATLDYRSVPGINSDGTITVNGSFSGAEGDPPSGTAIVVADAGGKSLAAYAGAPAPGAGEGHEFISTFYESVISSGGQIAFYGSEREDTTPPGQVRSGIWIGPPDDLRLVVQQGDPAPGLDATFGSFFRNTPAMNRVGQIAFSVVLQESVSGLNSNSLWATDREGDLTLIARVGQLLEVAPSDQRMISSLDMLTLHGDDDGRPRSVNDWGHVVFRANFDDGTSGVFLSSAVAHPEPSTGLMSLWLVALLGSRWVARREGRV